MGFSDPSGDGADERMHPGGYVDPLDARTISGVATSTTAFVGRTLRGPVNEPVAITSFPDFERSFGGLWAESTLGFAVRDFFLNGGSSAVIVRLHRRATAPDHAELSIGAGAGRLTLRAASPGAWGSALTMSVAEHGDDPGDPALFDLTVNDRATSHTEIFRGLSTQPASPRRVDRVLAEQSALVRVAGPLPTATLPVERGAASATPADDGQALDADAFTGAGRRAALEGLFALGKTDLFNLLVIPPYRRDGGVDAVVVEDAVAYCEQRRAMAVIDAPPSWASAAAAATGVPALPSSANAAVYFPRPRQPDPLRGNEDETFAASGAIAGVIARTDIEQGVWTAPAGVDARLAGVTTLSVPLSDDEINELTRFAVNGLRALPGGGIAVWGARTLATSDLSAEWKYVPIRRTVLFLEESIERGTQWAVFEPNNEPLWANIRLAVIRFMDDLFRHGAFAGSTPREAYFVACGHDTTTQDDLDRGFVDIVVGFAPLKPGELVTVRVRQIARGTMP